MKADQSLIARCQLRATGDVIHRLGSVLTVYLLLCDLDETPARLAKKAEIEAQLSAYCISGTLTSKSAGSVPDQG